MSLESLEQRGIDRDPQYFAEQAAKLADRDDNLLLNQQAVDFTRAYYGSLANAPSHLRQELEHANDRLTRAWQEGRLLRWLDTPMIGEEQMSEFERYAARVQRTINWIEQIRNHEGYAVYVTAPAFNEEEEIANLMHSLKDYATQYPIIAIIVADNNSTDRTADIVRSLNGNVVHAPLQGIGPARQVAIDHVDAHKILPTHQTLIMQTDADAVVSPRYTDIIAEQFAAVDNREKLIANGGVSYSFNWQGRPYIDHHGLAVPGELGQFDKLFSAEDAAFVDACADPDDGLIKIDNFARYGFFTGTRTLRSGFSALGYDLEDFIVGTKCYMLPGPNTAFRASLFEHFDHRYPSDDRWEQHDMAVKLQHWFRFETIGMTIGTDDRTKHGVTASARAIVGSGGYVPGYVGEYSAERFRFLRRNGLEPYKAATGRNTELGSFALTIADLGGVIAMDGSSATSRSSTDK